MKAPVQPTNTQQVRELGQENQAVKEKRSQQAAGAYRLHIYPTGVRS